MKKLILSLCLIISTITVQAQQEAYQKSMLKGLEMMGNAHDLNSLQEATNLFERIALKMDKDWLARYYASLGYARMSMIAEGIKSKDNYSDQALEYALIAKELSPNNSEVIALEGYIYMAQLVADPNSRGQILSAKIMQTYGEALRLKPDNPRAMALMAQMRYGTAQFFGSSTAEACEMAQNSLPLFKEGSQADSFEPSWGDEMARGLLSQCTK